MKKLILLLLVLTSINCYSQEKAAIATKTTSSVSRNTLQRLFIIKTFGGHQVKGEIKTTADLDSLYKEVNIAWKRYVKDSLVNKGINISVDALSNIDAYVSLMTYKDISGRSEYPDELEFYVYKNYMLPSLIRDYQLLKLNPSSINLKLINVPSTDDLIGIGLSHYSADINTFNALHKLYFDLKELLQSFSTSDPESVKYSERLLRIMANYEYDLQAKYYLLNNEPDKAMTNFSVGLAVDNYYKPNAVKFGRYMLKYFVGVNEKDKGFAILKALMFYTSNDDLPRDSLAQWYRQTDREKGAKLYRMIQQKISGNIFKTSDKVNLKIPQQWNLITNNISAQKLAGCKFIILDFWNTACVPCIEEMPELNQLASELKNRDDIIFLSVNADYSETKRNEAFVKNFIKQHNIQMPVVYDTKETNFNVQLKVLGYPSKFILDSSGRMISKIDDSQVTLSTIREFIKQNK